MSRSRKPAPTESRPPPYAVFGEQHHLSPRPPKARAKNRLQGPGGIASASLAPATRLRMSASVAGTGGITPPSSRSAGCSSSQFGILASADHHLATTAAKRTFSSPACTVPCLSKNHGSGCLLSPDSWRLCNDGALASASFGQLGKELLGKLAIWNAAQLWQEGPAFRTFEARWFQVAPKCPPVHVLLAIVRQCVSHSLLNPSCPPTSTTPSGKSQMLRGRQQGAVPAMNPKINQGILVCRGIVII